MKRLFSSIIWLIHLINITKRCFFIIWLWARENLPARIVKHFIRLEYKTSSCRLIEKQRTNNELGISKDVMLKKKKKVDGSGSTKEGRNIDYNLSLVDHGNTLGVLFSNSTLSAWTMTLNRITILSSPWLFFLFLSNECGEEMPLWKWKRMNKMSRVMNLICYLWQFSWKMLLSLLFLYLLFIHFLPYVRDWL